MGFQAPSAVQDRLMANQISNAKSTTSSGNAAAFDPWLLWIAFRRHWGWILPMGALLATLAAAAVIYTFEPTYEATHVLEANDEYVLAPLQKRSRDLAKSEKQLITHAIVLDRVLAKKLSAPSLANPFTAEREIRAHLSIGNAGTDNLLTVTYRDSDAKAAADVCNAIVESYLEARRSRDTERMSEIEQWLVEPINTWKRKVENLRQEITELTKMSQGYDPFNESVTVVGDSALKGLRSSLAQLEVEDTLLTAERKALEQEQLVEVDFMPRPLDIQQFVDADNEVQKYRARLVEVEARIRDLELRQLESFHQSRFADLQAKAQDERKDLEAAEEAARSRAKLVLSERDKENQKADFAAKASELDRKAFEMSARREALQKDYEEEKTRVETLGGETAEIFFAREDYEQASEILSQLNTRLNLLRTERARSASVETMAEARAPSWPVEEVPFKKIGMVAFGAFFVPFGLAILLEFRWKRITNSVGFEMAGLAPLVGEVAKIPGGPKTSRSHRLFEESIDALRANLLFRLEGVRTIAVSSSMPSEGKSSVASQLAISLAKASGETVLIVDTDLRSPDQHAIFGLDVEPGLSKFMSGEATLEQAIDKSLGDLVHVIPAGRLNCNPHNLLTKKRMQKLLSQLQEKYTYIVLDTAPVLPAAESLSVASAADATLLCAMRDVSRSDHVLRTQRRLEASGANIIGTVFSGVPANEYAYRYGDYRYSNRIAAK